MAIAVGPYSPAYRAGEFLFCSGQIGVGNGNELVGGFSAQARQAFENLQSLLEENACQLNSVVKTTVFLTDMDNYAAMNEIYAQAFGDHRPARSAVAVTALPKGASIEIEAIALPPG